LFKSRLEVLTGSKRFSRGLSVCIFPEGQIPDDVSIVLILSKMVFRLAIETSNYCSYYFGDNKEGFPTLF
jgi:1-acyl-sn-glycerol-3-phosphate acyltransferase